MQNFTESFFADEIAHGSLTMVEHSVGEPFIDAGDIADVAVSALLDTSHIGCVYELTGPALLTFGQVAQEISSATGRDVVYQELPVAAYVTELVAAGLAEEDASGLAHVFDEALDGRNAHLDDGVQSVLGREPRDFGEFLASALSVAGDTRG